MMVTKDGRTRHHGGAGRTIGDIYREGALRQGFRSRAEIAADQMAAYAELLGPHVYVLSERRAGQAALMQRTAARRWAAGEFEEAEECYSIARFIMGISESVTIKDITV